MKLIETESKMMVARGNRGGEVYCTLGGIVGKVSFIYVCGGGGVEHNKKISMEKN